MAAQTKVEPESENVKPRGSHALTVSVSMAGVNCSKQKFDKFLVQGYTTQFSLY